MAKCLINELTDTMSWSFRFAKRDEQNSVFIVSSIRRCLRWKEIIRNEMKANITEAAVNEFFFLYLRKELHERRI